MSEAVRLSEPDAGVSLAQMRVDVRRDTRIMVTRNVNKHIYIELGNRRDLTLIMHPHAAKRLIASIEEVMAGEDMSKL